MNDVTIALTADNQLETLDGALSLLPTLTFTTANWSLPQTVTLRAVQDALNEGFHYSRITHRIVSSLSDFIGVTAGDVRLGLAASVNSDLGSRVTATVSGSEIVLDGPAFTFLAGNNVTAGTNVAAWADALVTLSGPIASGTTWTLRLNGVPYSYTADTDDVLADAAAGLAAEINNGEAYTVVPTGGIFSVQASYVCPPSLAELSSRISKSASGKLQVQITCPSSAW